MHQALKGECGMGNTMIAIQHLTKDYGNQKGIFDLSFDIKEGEVFGFLGPNGAGKTTTIRHLMGFLYASQGECKVQGMDCGKDAAKIQKNLGYIPGEINLMEDMTGIQFLRFIKAYRGVQHRDRMAELIKRFALDTKGKIKKMSKGMKQKIAIVSAFMHDPQVLILDEPTSGLDPLMQSKFIELIFEEKKNGKSILMSSHMFEEVEKTCDRVGIIKDGHLMQVDTIENIKKARSKQYHITFASGKDAAAFCAKQPHAKRCSPTCVEIFIHQDIQDMINTLYESHVVRLDEISQSLEDVFMQFYGGK